VLGREVLAALERGDLAAAGVAGGLDFPDAFLADRALWRLRLAQLTEQPALAPWLIRAVVRAPDRVVVGHAGFHGPPDAGGMVEIGYEILPEHRRRGHARAAVAELLAFAREHGAVTARASIAPHNEPSQALVRSFGFVQVGDQWDDEDGLELVFERPL
jgi:[ribosomal protein S5]-alanine N-acetyltransferase